jgi:hypothetical protein
MSVLDTDHNSPTQLEEEAEERRVSQIPPSPAPHTDTLSEGPGNSAQERIQEYATREGVAGKHGFDKKNVVIVCGVLALAVAFFLFAQLTTKKPNHKPARTAQASKQPQPPKEKASITPNIDPYQNHTNEQVGGRVTIGDIERTRQPNYTKPSAGTPLNSPSTRPAASQVSRPLSSVPSFRDTQQSFHDPEPYGSAQPALAALQERSALTEASLVYVKSAQENASSLHSAQPSGDIPILQLKEGTRIQAHLESEASTAIHVPVVAVVDYTYAIGDQIMVQAGARILGRLTEADSSGDVGIVFTEILTLDGAHEKVSAVGAGLDMGPIKGNVYGKHEGRNFLVRAASGLGSAAAMLVGNNADGAYSQSDMIRDRAAANIGTTGDTELQVLNANTHIIVAVPANTRIYVVWTAQSKSNQNSK